MTAERKHWDQWHGTQFTDAEINQLIEVMECISAGCGRIEDARTISPHVRKFLLRWMLVDKGKIGYSFTDASRAQYGNEWLPVEALWRIVSPMLGPEPCTVSTSNRSVGYSIRKHAGWKTLGYWTAEQHLYSERDEREIEATLGLLAQYGYIWFLQSGSVWEITERKDRTI